LIIAFGSSGREGVDRRSRAVEIEDDIGEIIAGSELTPNNRLGSDRHMRSSPAATLRASLLALIAGYRRLISPLLPPACRFYPSCSEYASEAIVRHGAVRGSALATRRLTRCHPWCEGGVDPVPPARAQSHGRSARATLSRAEGVR
jgi:putative membrane protein insertion efficiency factor